MYTPNHFAESRPEQLHHLIRENPLGILVTHSSAGLDANHLPFLIDTEHRNGTVLLAHIARANPIGQQVRNGDPVLVIFRGAHGYISPNWYPGKHETHRRVPTWNYEVVHAHGTIQIHDDKNFVRSVVARLTRQHEASQPRPWKMGEAPADYLSKQLDAIVGLQIHVTRLEGKRKLNQHHEPADREGAIHGLEACGNHLLAQAMINAIKP